MSLPVAILCGGKGTRLSPLTDHLPKSLVDICGQPFIVRQLDLLKRHGYTEITLLIHHLGRQIMEAVGDGSAFGVAVRYSEDGRHLPHPDEAIWQSSAWTEQEACFVLYGDSYLDCDYQKFERAFLTSGCEKLDTRYQHDGYGLRAFRHTPTRPRMELRIEMQQPYEEIGSFDGLARVRAIVEEELCRQWMMK